MTPVEFCQKIVIYDRKEQWLENDGVVYTYKLIKRLSWWNRFYIYYFLRLLCRFPWARDTFKMFITLKLVADGMKPGERLVWGICYPDVYFSAARAARKFEITTSALA